MCVRPTSLLWFDAEHPANTPVLQACSSAWLCPGDGHFRRGRLKSLGYCPGRHWSWSLGMSEFSPEWAGRKQGHLAHPPLSTHSQFLACLSQRRRSLGLPSNWIGTEHPISLLPVWAGASWQQQEKGWYRHLFPLFYNFIARSWWDNVHIYIGFVWVCKAWRCVKAHHSIDLLN